MALVPSTKVELDSTTVLKLLRLIGALEDLNEVQEVYHKGHTSYCVFNELKLV